MGPTFDLEGVFKGALNTNLRELESDIRMSENERPVGEAMPRLCEHDIIITRIQIVIL